MIDKDQIYELKLEDYSYPRYMPALKSYYGSMSDIIALVVRLEDDQATATRYKGTLEAAEYCDLGEELYHNMAGQMVPFCVPVEELSRLDTTVHNKEWVYTTFSGAQYPCKASEIELRQSLLRTNDGFVVSIRANIIGLQVCYPAFGWIYPKSKIDGFPGTVTYGEDTHRMELSATMAEYSFDELEFAKADALNPDLINWPCLVADIIAEG